MDDETLLRLGIFFGLFILLALAERLLPRRPLSQPRSERWITNWVMSFLNTLSLRVLAIALPFLAIGAAVDAQALGFGLFNRLMWPPLLEGALTLLILDFAIWAQHVLTHKLPFLWRFHRVHHADRDMDVTTAIRFHPVEIALSMLLKIGLIYLIGPMVVAVVVFEILLNAAAMFSHANLRLSPKLDRVLRLMIVTPDMHRVHHSVHRDEHDSNYGFALSLWDRVFGTYTSEPREGHDGMAIGLEWQNEKPSRLGWALSLPFRKN